MIARILRGISLTDIPCAVTQSSSLQLWLAQSG